MKKQQLKISSGLSNGGTYVLRLRVKSRLRLSFGQFQKGKRFTVEPGEYCYIGSALEEKGANSIAGRLLTHTARTQGKPSHGIRCYLHERFLELGMTKQLKLDAKPRLYYHVDYLVERPQVSIERIYVIRDLTRIEAKLGRLIGNDTATSVIAISLGASDIKGNTHLLRVDADELWWRLLPCRMRTLVAPTDSSQLVESYLRGRRCLPSPVEAISNGRLSFAKGTASQATAAEIAEQVDMPVSDVIKDAKFAAAVNAIISNCGEEAVDASFFSRIPQARKAIERIARTSDVRQRYRVDGVLDGRFRSIGPQCDDPVYDTVSFSEVTSRLGRADGLLAKWSATRHHFRKSDFVDVRDLVERCHAATTVLRDLIKNGPCATNRVPVAIERDSIKAASAEFTANGQAIGKPKAALKLIAKNVWDFPEMKRRGIVPTPHERTTSLAKLAAILDTTTKLKVHLR